MLLNEYGFAYVWNNPRNIHVTSFLSAFKQRVIDCFCQKWLSDIQTNNVLNTLYVHIKEKLYLNVLDKNIQNFEFLRIFYAYRLVDMGERESFS